MQIQIFSFNAFRENTVVLWNEKKEAIIIDPGMSNRVEEGEFLEWFKQHDLNLIDVWLTHCHIDHIMGLDFIYREFGMKGKAHALDAVNVERSPIVAGMYGISYTEGPVPDYVIEEGNLRAGDFATQILFVPGHSPGHVAFYFEDEQVVINGDCLFEGSVGRTDLPGGNAEQLAESIRTKLYTLPDETVVVCGHGDNTTIGAEKRSNPFVRA
jgi:glyoxylase-like metal-dependent hydrolase (beta-lactamase superfamily II)